MRLEKWEAKEGDIIKINSDEKTNKIKKSSENSLRETKYTGFETKSREIYTDLDIINYGRKID